MTPAIVNARLKQTLEPLLTRLVRPQTLSGAATRIPDWVTFRVVEKIVNTAFADQISEGDFDFLGGRTLQVEIIDAGLFVGLSYISGKIVCQHFSDSPRASEVTLSVASINAIQLIQQEIDPDTLFFQRKLKINGDTELAHHVKNTIDTLDPDVIPPQLLKLISAYRTHVLEPTI